MPDANALRSLADEWARRAERKYANADAEQAAGDADGARLIRHGATCYLNAALELRRALDPGEVARLAEAERGRAADALGAEVDAVRDGLLGRIANES